MAHKTIPIFLPGDEVVWITAGPTRELLHTHRLIRCAEEIPVPKDRIAFDISTKDFRPFDDDVIRKDLPHILTALIRGERLYVGCMGGTGRTGTFLSILAAQHPGMLGEDAIAYVRMTYRSGAVETEEQEAQVARLSHVYTGELAFTRPDPVEATEPDDFGYTPAPEPLMVRVFLRIAEWLSAIKRKRG